MSERRVVALALVLASCGGGGGGGDAGETGDGSGPATSATTATSSSSGGASTSTGSESGASSDESSDTAPPGYQPDVLWVFAFGGEMDQVGMEAQALPDGGVVFVGSTDVAIDIEGSTIDPFSDQFIGILDANGQFQSSIEIMERATIAVTATGQLVVGEGKESASPSVVRLLEIDGTEVWSTSLGPDIVSLEDVEVDSDGNVVAAGWFSNTIDLGNGAITSAGGADAFVVKLDPDGVPLWVQTYGGRDGEYARQAVVDAAGNVHVAGHFQSSIDLGGDVLMGRDGVYVAQLDPDGAHQWSEGMVFSTFEPQGLELDAAGSGLLLVGSVLASSSLTKFDATGAMQWSMGGGVSTPYGLVVFPDGDILVGGIAGLSAWTVTHLDPDGTEQWLWQVSGEGPDHNSDAVVDMTLDVDGNLLLAGWITGVADFGTGDVPHVAERDGVIVKVADP